jgi:hypothetical protein
MKHFRVTGLRVTILMAVTSTILDASSITFKGFGTPVIDGVLTPGEWSAATKVDFTANTPYGGTAPASLRVMNDANNLYFALTLAYAPFNRNSIAVEFSNTDSGIAANGDDAFVFGVELDGTSTFFDDFRTNAPPCAPLSLPAACGFLDVDYGGTNDGGGGFSHLAGVYTWEVWHPLRSGDVHDVNLHAGNSVGFYLSSRLIDGPYAEGFGDTDYPAFRDYAHIIIQDAPEPSMAWLIGCGLAALLTRALLVRGVGKACRFVR